MPRKKTTHKPLPLQQMVGFLQGAGRPYVLALTVALGCATASFVAWQQVHTRSLQSPQYWVGEQNVSVTPLPNWIHRNLKGEVFRDAAIRLPVSLCDPNLCGRIAAGFAMHPWIHAVHTVRKYYPGRVHVEVSFRRPVCMVHVLGGLLPVDSRGILLPGEDFSPLEAARYPRLEGVDRPPAGPAGHPWGDVRVSAAAAIAAALEADWLQMQLDHIRAQPVPRSGYQYELFTASGTRIVWGNAPGTEIPGEPNAKEKVLRLRAYFREHQSLDGPHGSQVLDVRGAWTAHTLGSLPRRRGAQR